MFFMHTFVFTQNFILIELVSPTSFKKVINSSTADTLLLNTEKQKIQMVVQEVDANIRWLFQKTNFGVWKKLQFNICGTIEYSEIKTQPSTLLGGDVHTQFLTQNIKMTFSVQPTNPLHKTLGVTKYFFCCKTSCIGTIGNRKEGLPTIPR